MPVGVTCYTAILAFCCPDPWTFSSYSDLCAQHDGPHVPAQQQGLLWVYKAVSQQTNILPEKPLEQEVPILIHYKTPHILQTEIPDG